MSFIILIRIVLGEYIQTCFIGTNLFISFYCTFLNSQRERVQTKYVKSEPFDSNEIQKSSQDLCIIKMGQFVATL